MFDSITNIYILIIIINISTVVSYYIINKRIKHIKRDSELTMKTLENLLVLLSDDIRLNHNIYKAQ